MFFLPYTSSQRHGWSRESTVALKEVPHAAATQGVGFAPRVQAPECPPHSPSPRAPFTAPLQVAPGAGAASLP